ncbi:MAG: hypothetical protein SFZ23_05460 [Planctomycetota bacterium]|nr:hypothetical protein [Planctomycetota bacterium]
MIKQKTEDNGRTGDQRAPRAAAKTRPWVLVACAALLAGGFVWFKMRVVTGIPRSAYADPSAGKVAAAPERASEVAGKPQHEDGLETTPAASSTAASSTTTQGDGPE